MHFFTTATIITLLASLALAAPIPGPADGFLRGAAKVFRGQTAENVVGAVKDTVQAKNDDRAASAKRVADANARANAILQRQAIAQQVMAKKDEKKRT